jgi:hypothetical protein
MHALGLLANEPTQKWRSISLTQSICRLAGQTRYTEQQLRTGRCGGLASGGCFAPMFNDQTGSYNHGRGTAYLDWMRALQQHAG